MTKKSSKGKHLNCTQKVAKKYIRKDRNKAQVYIMYPYTYNYLSWPHTKLLIIVRALLLP